MSLKTSFGNYLFVAVNGSMVSGRMIRSTIMPLHFLSVKNFITQ